MSIIISHDNKIKSFLIFSLASNNALPDSDSSLTKNTSALLPTTSVTPEWFFVTKIKMSYGPNPAASKTSN